MDKKSNSIFYNGDPICPPNCEYRQPACQAYCRIFLSGKKERDKRIADINKQKNLERILNNKPKPVRTKKG